MTIIIPRHYCKCYIGTVIMTVSLIDFVRATECYVTGVSDLNSETLNSTFFEIKFILFGNIMISNSFLNLNH